MSEQRKIAIISFHSCPFARLGFRDTGGMNVYIQELAQELGKRGHIVDIYTRAHPHEHIPEVSLGQNVRLVHIQTGAYEEMPKLALYTQLSDFMCGIEQHRKSTKIDYDVIHSHYWLSALAGKQLQIWWHIPHLVMLHTLGAVKNKFAIDLDEPELRIESEKEVIHGCDRIIAATSREKKELIHLYNASPQKITVIPCGVNIDLFKPMDTEMARAELGFDHQKIALFVGRLDPLKGLEQLIKALGYFSHNEIPELIIIGGDERSQNRVETLQTLAAELNVQDRIRFLGSINQKRLPLFYNAADISVIPSYYESFGMVALESLACGTPVLATDVGSMRNVICHPESGYVIKNNSPALLASKMTKLLSQSENRARNIEKRRSTAAQYSWKTITDMILNEYIMTRKSYSPVIRT
jgi:D-inositol-3-phosphate glycosyltransferase